MAAAGEMETGGACAGNTHSLSCDGTGSLRRDWAPSRTRRKKSRGDDGPQPIQYHGFRHAYHRPLSAVHRQSQVEANQSSFRLISGQEYRATLSTPAATTTNESARASPPTRRDTRGTPQRSPDQPCQLSKARTFSSWQRSFRSIGGKKDTKCRTSGLLSFTRW